MLAIDPNFQLTKNIALWEFMEGTKKDRTNIPQELVDMAWLHLDQEKLYNAIRISSICQAARDYFGKSFVITCGARPRAWDVLMGREYVSYHGLYGAIDGYLEGVTLQDYFNWCNQFLLYSNGRAIHKAQNFVHLDMGPKNTWEY